MESLLEKLPLEIRRGIYHEVLADTSNPNPPGIEIGFCSTKPEVQRAILQVCKQTYVEASSVLYEEGLFRFTAHREDEVQRTWWSRLPPQALARIRHVCITNFG